MWRSKFLISLVITTLFLTACGKEPPQPTSTPRPTATATLVPTATPVPPTPAPTATPQIVETLPEGCVGWLRGLPQIVYLCDQDQQTTLSMNGQCAIVEATAPLIIHFLPRDVSSKPGQVIKKPGESLCSTEPALYDIWAEPIDDSQPAPTVVMESLPNGCFGTLKGTDVNIPLCTEDQKQQIVLNPTQCLTVETSIPVKIFFVNPPDWTLVYSVGTVDKAPGEELCNGADFVVTTEIWAEALTD